jgi:hypothetical protein
MQYLSHKHTLQEKNELLQRLDCSRERLIAAVAGLSQPQGNFKPSPDAWSVAGKDDIPAGQRKVQRLRCGPL